jgi:hypothetical protein
LPPSSVTFAAFLATLLDLLLDLFAALLDAPLDVLRLGAVALVARDAHGRESEQAGEKLPCDKRSHVFLLSR